MSRPKRVRNQKGVVAHKSSNVPKPALPVAQANYETGTSNSALSKKRKRDSRVDALKTVLANNRKIERDYSKLYIGTTNVEEVVAFFPNFPLETWEENNYINEDSRLVTRAPTGAFILPKINSDPAWHERNRLFCLAFEGDAIQKKQYKPMYNCFVHELARKLKPYVGNSPSKEFLISFCTSVVNKFEGLKDSSAFGNASLVKRLIDQLKKPF